MTIIEFNYQDLDSKEGLINHCKMSDINLKQVNHTKMKNYVMNNLYCADEINDSERMIFTIFYDLKSQQKYLPWITTSQEKIWLILNKSSWTISAGIKKLIQFNMLIKQKDRFGAVIFIPNENINTWWVSIDTDRLSYLEETRKHCASSNVQLTQEYKKHIKNEE